MMLAAVDADTPAYAELQVWLESEHLATSDMAEGTPRFFRLADAVGSTLGFAGIAGEGEARLLRSVVIKPAARGTGAGARLVEMLEAEARADGADSLWLLSQGAAPFFARAGYAVADRADAPSVICDTAQFQGLCPASAALMCKTLR